jgi:glycosyltransferase involved in cell wall biosynthesis
MAVAPPNVVLVKGNYVRAGGPETVLGSLVRGLDRTRFQPTLVVLRKSGGPEAAAFTADPGVRRDVAWGGLLGAPLAARRLLRLAGRGDVALLHTHDMRSNLAAYLATRVRRMPWIAHVHGWLGVTHRGRWRLYEQIDRRVVRFAARVLVGSTAAMQELQSLGVQRIEVVPYAVEIPPAGTGADEARRIRRQLGVGPDAVVIGVVGRLHRGKAVDLILRGVARLRESGRDVRGLIVGEGPDAEALHGLARELRVQDFVTFTGFRDDATPLMAAMDIFVSASLRETGPLTVLEAMALGRAVISSRVGLAPEAIADGTNGLIVPPGDLAALVTAMESLVADPPLRWTFGERGRAVVVDRFSATALVRAVERHYDSLLGAQAHASRA